jgi:hypothetical protein
MMIDDLMEDCTMLDKRSIPDGQGGFDYTWEDGAPFLATIVKNGSLEARVAEKSGVKDTYTITVYKGTPLIVNDVFRREKDGATFRVTSNVTDTESPPMASFQIGNVSAERWDIT